MPLIKSPSKAALQKNIKTEMGANPSPSDRKQNLAIAYSVQRRNRKKMAQGGEADDSSMEKGMASIRNAFASSKKYDQSSQTQPEPTPSPYPMEDDSDDDSSMEKGMASIRNSFASSKKYAQGGTISARDERRADADDDYSDMKPMMGRSELSARDESTDPKQMTHEDALNDSMPKMHAPDLNEYEESMYGNDGHMDDERSKEMMKNRSPSRIMPRAADMRPDADNDDSEDRDMMRMARGGMAMKPKMSIAMAIRKKMFDGGNITDAEGMDQRDDDDTIDLTTHNMPLRNHVNALSSRAGMDEHDSEKQMMDEAYHPMDSAQDGDDLMDEDKNSMASIIRARRKR